MLRDHVAPDLELLADHLASSLVGPVADPFAPELVVVPTVGVRAWLRQRLSHSLGVTANISFPLPGRLRRLVLGGGGDTPDPWEEASVAWVVHEILLRPPRGLDLGPAGVPPKGTTRYRRAARLARLFDHYHVHRPEMIRRWVEVSGQDSSLGDRRWQAALWWAVRERIGSPSPPESVPEALARLRGGDPRPDLPPRLSLFGFTSLTPDLVALVAAAGEGRDVDLYRLRHVPPPISAAGPGHPLGGSWGRQSVTFGRLLDELAPEREVHEIDADPAPATTVLSGLQAAVRRGRSEPSLPPADDSVQVHGCKGDTRQVEVLREVLLHLLAASPDLDESDIVVLCPDLQRFAPIVEGVFGGPAAPDGPPRLRFLLSERRPGWSDPLVAAASGLLGLVGGRYRASEVLDFLALEAVSRRFALDPDEMDTVAQWLQDTGVAWGLDVGSRARWGLPDLAQSTFASGMDRLLVGVVTSAGTLETGPGGVVPRPIRGDRASLVGRAWAFVSTLARVEAMFSGEKTLAGWVEALRLAISVVAAPDPESTDGDVRLESILTTMTREAEVALGDTANTAPMDLAEFRAAVEVRLEPRVGGAYFGTGSITFASPASLAMVPREVVCLLGLDDDALSAGSVDGDDLLPLAPRDGDRDPRAENRSLLLDALMSARRHLIVTYGDHDLARNRPRPPAVPVAELIDVLPATTNRPVEHHPRHRFDPANFAPSDPWSFDPRALDAARVSLRSVAEAGEYERARREDRRLAAEVLTSEAPMIDVGGLIRMLQRPSAGYLREAVGVGLRSPAESTPDLIPITDGPLTRWQRHSRLLELIDEAGCHSSPGPLISRWRAVERSTGTLAPGALGEVILDDTAACVSELVAAVAEVLPGDGGGRDFTEVELDLELPGGTGPITLVGRCGFRAGFGPVRISASKEPVDHILEAWVQLLALTVARPDVDWTALAVCLADRRKVSAVTWHRSVAGPTPGEREATARSTLAELVGMYRRGMCEPLPVFGRTSRRLARDDRKGARAKWHGHDGSGEADRAEVVAVWGRLSFEDLLAIPVRDDDPPGRGDSRVERYANRLWGLVEHSTADPR